ncbi:hypothetical protein AAFF_G00440940 [Aldrovandia affinis]|uniref:Somatostatin/Cortistatin C-terminal domain-containing protein n=1 Tax=Aldrovandia affinis TaxID=143900 RepID=A0AAD7WHX2_9TELE|nr:hypothetical protein AAFF_G00440940 [Aldrovandia affinis]
MPNITPSRQPDCSPFQPSSPSSMQPLRVHTALALLGLVLTLCSLSASSQPDVRYRRVLQRARAANMDTQLAPLEGDVAVAQVSTTGGSKDAHGDVRPPPKRKAGCKNYYWKGPTSC